MGWFALLFVVVGAVTIGLAGLGLLTPSVIPAMSAVLIVSSALLAIARYRKVATPWALRGALVGLVAFCGIFSFAIARNRYLQFGVPGDATWTCVLLVAFPLLIPSPPREAGVALFIGALTAPLGVLWVAETTDFTFGDRTLLTYAMSPMAAALIGYFGTRTVYRLGLDLERAQRLGAYELVSRLGSGGMGEVWAARHARLARPAAIKFVRLEHMTGSERELHELQERFAREAEATASLRSPHTVEVYDFGASADGRFYYAMELLDGVDLEALIAVFGPVPPERAIYLLLQVLDSLQEAHEAGIVHRDIKPANIIVCRYGNAVDFVKVVDFGLARRRDDARLTEQDVVAGTPAYLAPELARSRCEPSASSDLYAVGCVAFWLLTGRTVFEGPTRMAQLMSHVSDIPPNVGDVAPGPIPARLASLVESALSKHPEMRPASAEAFAAELRLIATDEAWTPERARSWWDRHIQPGMPAADAVLPAETRDSMPMLDERKTLFAALFDANTHISNGPKATRLSDERALPSWPASNAHELPAPPRSDER